MINQFNPNDHLTKLRGKSGDYLEVKWRLVWFRDQHPHGEISTELLQLDLEKGVAVFKAVIRDGEGGEAAGHGSETAKDFGDYLEKAETKAIGRALAALGYGTQFAPELEEGARIADSPVERKTRDEQLHSLTRPGPARLTNGDGTEASPKPYTLEEVKTLFLKLFKPEKWEGFKMHVLDIAPPDEGLGDAELSRLYGKLVELRREKAPATSGK